MSERITGRSIKDSILGKKELVSLPGFGELTVIRPETPVGVVDVSGLLDDHYINRTTFDHAVITFGRIFEQMKRSSIPAGKRWGISQPVPKRITVIPCNQAMDNMTLIANTPRAYKDMDLKRKYRENLARVLGGIKRSGQLSPQPERVAIKRAGLVAAELLYGEDHRALVIDGKRLPFRDGTLGVGFNDESNALIQERLHGQDIEIDEVFLATGSTILGLMADSHSRGINPRNLTIVAPFTTQQGAEIVLDLSKQIGWDTRIVASRLYYAMNQNWYVLVSPDASLWQRVLDRNPDIVEVQAGGDAGDLTEI